VTPATWWALAFIAACAALIIWVRVKYPLPDPSRSRRPSRQRASDRRRSSKRSSSEACRRGAKEAVAL